MRLRCASLALVALFGGVAAGNTTVTFNNFSSTAGLTLNGDATAVANDGAGDTNVLQLVPTNELFQYGTAFSTTPLQASSGFSTVFQWRMTQPGGITDAAGQTGADGLTFTVQNVSSSAGEAGEGIGYGGISPSVAVKFDTFQNTDLNDPSSNYIGVASNGDLNNADYPSGQTNVASPFDNGTVWTAWVDYNGSELSIYAADAATSVKPATPLLTYNFNITSILGTSTAFVGFTSAGGDAYENVYLLDWTYYDFFNPTGTGSPAVGLPSSAWMGLTLLAGLGSMKLIQRRKAVLQ